MRVLCQKSDDKYLYMRDAWRRVFESAGDTFVEWDVRTKPAFDAFDEVDPDIYIQTLRSPDNAASKCIALRVPRMKVVDATNPVPGLDTISYTPGIQSKWLKCDIAYVGSYHPDKLEVITPLLDTYHVKVVGRTAWPIPQYLGKAEVATVRNLYASARVSLHLGGPLSERPYQILGAGGFPVGDNVGMGFPKLEHLHSYVKPPVYIRSEMDDSVEESVQKIKHGETYFHVVAQMLEDVGLYAHAAQIMGAYHASQGL